MNRILLLTCPTFDPLRSAMYLNGWLLKTEDLNYNDPAIESLFQSFQELPHTETHQRELEGDFDPDWTWPDHVDFDDYFPAQNQGSPTMQQAASIALRLAAFDSDFWGPEKYQAERVMTHLIEGLENHPLHRDVWQALTEGSTEIDYNDQAFWVTENGDLENGRTWKIKIADTGFMPDEGIVELL